MAAGVIPVYSDVIDDSYFIFTDLKYAIPFTTKDECLSKILEMEQKPIDFEMIKKEYCKLFDSYYSVNLLNPYLI